MSDEPTAAGLEAWRSFIRAYAAVVGALERELEEECGLPLPWYDVLLQLAEAGRGGLRMSALAEAVLLSRSGLTRLVDRMVDEGLLKRRAQPSDRRATIVALTPAGRRRLRAAAPVHLRGIEEHFASRLSPRQADEVRRALRRVVGSESRQ